jgi:hypothetical protein
MWDDLHIMHAVVLIDRLNVQRKKRVESHLHAHNTKQKIEGEMVGVSLERHQLFKMHFVCVVLS